KANRRGNSANLAVLGMLEIKHQLLLGNKRVLECLLRVVDRSDRRFSSQPRDPFCCRRVVRTASSSWVTCSRFFRRAAKAARYGSQRGSELSRPLMIFPRGRAAARVLPQAASRPLPGSTRNHVRAWVVLAQRDVPRCQTNVLLHPARGTVVVSVPLC